MQHYPSDANWAAARWTMQPEVGSRLQGAGFTDITTLCLDGGSVGMQQLLPGIDHWRTESDGDCGIDVYGNHRVAAGDIASSGFDSYYVCQPSGLPNRLYRNRGDGTFEDITDVSGTGLIDGTASALFADFSNRAAQRQTAGAIARPPITDQQNGFAWPDTSVGVLKTDSGLLFFASDGAHHDQNNKYGSVTRTAGTLENPLGTGSPINVVISPSTNPSLNPNYGSYTYLGGARVRAIPAGAPGAGNLIVVYHAEINTETSFYSLLGLALSTDGGLHWTDLGEMIRPNQRYAKDLSGFDIGSEPLVISPDGAYFYLYFPDWIANGTTQPTTTTHFSVARASIASVYEAASGAAPHAAAFTKFLNGAWDQPGIGGLSTDLNPNAAYAGDPNVTFDNVLERYIMINDDKQHIAYSESPDGMKWTLPMLLTQDLDTATGINYAVALGDGSDPNVLGGEFHVYFTFSSTEGWPGNSLKRLKSVASDCLTPATVAG